MEDGEELNTFIKVWLIAIASLCYCYLIPNRIPSGFRRLLSVLPIIAAFCILPLPLSAVHLAAPTIFYLVWLGNFKLLLFAFDRGPLASEPPLRFVHFMAVALLPINLIHAGEKIPNPDSIRYPDLDSASVSLDKPMLLTIKALILAVFAVVIAVVASHYRDRLHKSVILGFYCLCVYLGVELVLAITELKPRLRSVDSAPINPKHAAETITDPDPDLNRVSSHKPMILTTKALILAVIAAVIAVIASHYRDYLHRYVILGFYCLYVFLGVKLVLAIAALKSPLRSVVPLPINPKHASSKSFPDLDSTPDSIRITSHKPILLPIKALILALIVAAYQYRDHFHPNLISGLYCIHVYLGVELVLAMTAFFVRFFIRFDFEIEPQFNEPYLATSLQDFWGRRWNLTVTRILRPSVYDPVREITSPVIGNLWSRLPAIFATFVVSGLMHELIYLYLTRVRPTWEVTWFFVVQGGCTAVEVAVKKAVNGRFVLHTAVSRLLTVAFVAVTGGWLFLPQIIRNGVDVKAINEYSILVNFLRSKLG